MQARREIAYHSIIDCLDGIARADGRDRGIMPCSGQLTFCLLACLRGTVCGIFVVLYEAVAIDRCARQYDFAGHYAVQVIPMVLRIGE